MFRNSMNEEGKKLIDIVNDEIQREKHKWNEKGKNAEIFKYRLGIPDAFGSRILLLTFYNNVEVYITFTSIKICRLLRKSPN